MGQAESAEIPTETTPTSNSSQPASLESVLAAYGNQDTKSIEAMAQKALQCPCIADLRTGPCGSQFSEAFLCFLKSTSEEKKIVIAVDMKTDKARSKALKIAAACRGVHSVSIEGESKDQVAVTGDGIDSVCLTSRLRKKFCYATILSIADVKASDDAGGSTKEKEKEKEKETTSTYCYCPCPCPCPYPSLCPSLQVVYYEPHPPGCSIL